MFAKFCSAILFSHHQLIPEGYGYYTYIYIYITISILFLNNFALIIPSISNNTVNQRYWKRRYSNIFTDLLKMLNKHFNTF